MKAKQSAKEESHKSIKIRREHYIMVLDNKERTGRNIDFFVGQAIVEKLQKEKK